MANKKDEKKKKNKYSRKPASLMTEGLKATKELKEIAEQALKAGKRTKYKGKLTKTGKDQLAIKSVTDPADKQAIAKAKTIKGRKEALNSKASQRSLAKNATKQERRAIKEAEAKAKSRYAKSQASQDAQKMRDRNQITKTRILTERDKRKALKEGKPPAVPSGVNERRLPPKTLKPKTSANAKQSNQIKVTPKAGVPDKIEKKGKTVIGNPSKKTPKFSKGEKIAGTVGAGVAGKVAYDKLTGEKLNTNVKENKPIDIKGRSSKPSETKTDVKARDPKVNNSGRNSYNAKTPKNAELKKPTKAPSMNELYDKAVSSKEVQEKLGGRKVSQKVKSEAIAKARAYQKKNKDVPWEKILESITLLLSSHIMSRGISKRYK